MKTHAASARTYTTVGHVTVDLLGDEQRRPGGTALYSALQAARLGWDATIVTQGHPDELAELLAPFADELHVRAIPAAHTTTLATVRGDGAEPVQNVRAWAGAMPADLDVDVAGDVVHLAPVARELPPRWQGDAQMLTLTPQGLARAWTEPERAMRNAAPPAAAASLAARCQAIVLSAHERPYCKALLAAARAAGAVVAITDGPGATTILNGGGGAAELRVPVAPLAPVVDDLGAGDVFAAAFFVALAEGREARDAAAFASAAAAVRMSGVGVGAIGSRASIEARLRAVAGASDVKRPARRRRAPPPRRPAP